MELQKDVENAMQQFNILFGNMFVFDADSMTAYDKCYSDVFKTGINMSYMSLIFFAQFSAEILIGLLSSNPFRKFLISSIEDEKGRAENQMIYWEEHMQELRFGRPNVDYSKDIKELMAMADDSYIKIAALNEWFDTDDGRKEFEMYCLSKKAVRDIKQIICEYPYIIRRYDFDQEFANEIMEYAGIIAKEINNV